MGGEVIPGPWSENAGPAVSESPPGADGPGPSISAAFQIATDALELLGLSEQSKTTMTRLWARFVRYAEVGHGLAHPSEISREIVTAWIVAPHKSRQAPAESTKRHRRSAVRLLFKLWREAGIVSTDPTLDIQFSREQGTTARALTDAEVELCRAASLAAAVATRHATAWALAESGAHTSEIPFVRGCDVDVSKSEVWIAGSTKTSARFVPVSDWAVLQLTRRADALGWPDLPLAYQGAGDPGSAQASVSKAIGQVLSRAGLHGPEVTPRSVTAWVGQNVMAETGRIDEVANRLGLRSLDRAATLITLGWNTNE